MKTHIAEFKAPFLKKTGLVIASLFFILALMINILPFLDGRDDLMDFGSFYASGIKVANGENPYDPDSEYIFEIVFSRVGAGGKMMNLNPPISIPIFEYLSRFDPHRSLIVWQVVSAVLYIGAAFGLGFYYRQNLTPVKFLWAFILAGFWHTIVLGQVYIVLLVFVILGWIFLERRQYVIAGLAIGLAMAIKPNFVVWTLFLLISGYYTTVAVSFISGLVVSLIPVLIYGTGIYARWLEASALRVETLTMPGNNSILGLTARFESIPAGLIVSGLVVLGLLVLSRWKTSSDLTKSEYVSALGIITSLLASPITWTGYTILLLPIFFSLKKWDPPVSFSALILAIPFQIILQFFQTSYVSFVVFGWFYGWAILLLLVYLLRTRAAPRQVQLI